MTTNEKPQVVHWKTSGRDKLNAIGDAIDGFIESEFDYMGIGVSKVVDNNDNTWNGFVEIRVNSYNKYEPKDGSYSVIERTSCGIENLDLCQRKRLN